MATRERPVDRGRRLAIRLGGVVGRELRDARHASGASQAAIAAASDLSQAQISRVEMGKLSSMRLGDLAVHCAVLGLRLAVQVYPEGSPVRDQAHLRLLARFKEAISPTWTWSTEVPVARNGDLRAWDAELSGPIRIAVDAETRLSDVQALQRREELKLRDGKAQRLVLLVSATAHNRAVLREHREALRGPFPVDTANVLGALRHGRDPGANGIVIL